MRITAFVQIFDRGRFPVVQKEFRFQLKLQLPLFPSAKSRTAQFQEINFRKQPVARPSADTFEFGVRVVPAVMSITDREATVQIITQEEGIHFCFSVQSDPGDLIFS